MKMPMPNAFKRGDLVEWNSEAGRVRGVIVKKVVVREDAVGSAWRVVDPVLGNATPVHEYESKTWGPAEADQIVVADGGWHNP